MADIRFQTLRRATLSIDGRRSLLSDPIKIPARFDKKSGEYIVLWRDIQQFFKGAQYIMRGDAAVPFIIDEDTFEVLIPERIEYFPDDILDVVVDTPEPKKAIMRDVAPLSPVSLLSPVSPSSLSSASVLPESPPSSLLPAAPASPTPAISKSLPASGNFSDTEDYQVALQHMDTLVIAAPRTASENNLVATDPSALTAEVQSSLQSYKELQSNYLQAILCGQVNQASSIKVAMEQHFGDLKVEMDKNSALQETIFQMQQQMHDMQKQTLDRLAIVQGQIQAVLTQTYELHEYPIPRLFIILPKPCRRRDTFSKTFVTQFRLYFLCECGKHTMTESSKTPHEIHLAKHEGYDLDRPSEFFEKYGSYVLTMMEMIKFGFTAAGIIVPALGNLKIIEGLDLVEKGLGMVNKTFGSLVDETISHIKGQQNRTGTEFGTSDENAPLNKQEVLEGADLRQLESYLKVRDECRVLGNLYRIATSEGHIKWVCIDHYRENYRATTTVHLKEVVKVNRGQFIEDEGRIEITIASRTLANQFYGALEKARAILELRIKLDWDASMEDVRALASTVTKTNIVSLAIDGSAFTSSAFSLLSSSRRFEPIIELLSNGRVQSLKLSKFTNFYERVGGSISATAPQLRILSIDSELAMTSRNDTTAFTRILNKCPQLTELAVSSDDITQALRFIFKESPSLQSVQTLAVKSTRRNFTVVFGLQQGKIDVMEIEASQLVRVAYQWGKESFLLSGRLSKLVVTGPNLATASKDVFVMLLELNPRLSEIQYHGNASFHHGIINLVQGARKTIVWQRGSCSLRLLQICHNDYGDHKCQGRTMDSNWTMDSNFIKMLLEFSETMDDVDAHTRIVMGSSDQASNMDDHFRHHGWSVTSLITNANFSDSQAKLLCESMEGNTSKLEDLVLNPTSLSVEGMACIERIIKASRNLVTLSLCLEDLEEDEQLKKAIQFLTRHGARIKGLTLYGTSADAWLTIVGSGLPSRQDLPALTKFQLTRKKQHESLGIYDERSQAVSIDAAYWIAAMISSPSEALSGPQNPLSQSGCIEEPMSLETIALEGLQLESESWTRIIQALDITALENLSLENSNIASTQLEMLAKHVPAYVSVTPELQRHNEVVSSRPIFH
ncbi:hypothetical protein BGX28_002411 [Mortierella sp. GBA30]|nr:hypothetical protein BGX28_002411 [Mortierella sp. GBA30]